MYGSSSVSTVTSSGSSTSTVSVTVSCGSTLFSTVSITRGCTDAFGVSAFTTSSSELDTEIPNIKVMAMIADAETTRIILFLNVFFNA